MVPLWGGNSSVLRSLCFVLCGLCFDTSLRTYRQLTGADGRVTGVEERVSVPPLVIAAHCVNYLNEMKSGSALTLKLPINRFITDRRYLIALDLGI